MEEVVGSIPTRSTKSVNVGGRSPQNLHPFMKWALPHVPLSACWAANTGVVSVTGQKRVGSREGGEIPLHEIFNELGDHIQSLLGYAFIRDHLERAGNEQHGPDRNVVPVFGALEHVGQPAPRWCEFYEFKFPMTCQPLDEIQGRRKQRDDGASRWRCQPWRWRFLPCS